MNRRDYTSILWSILIFIACTSFAWAGQRAPAPTLTPANVGQVDLVTDWACPQSVNADVFTEMPLALSLTTTGGPVLISFTINFWAGGGMMTIFRPFVDEVDMGAEVNWWASVRGLVTFMRVVMLPAGVHHFGATMACQAASTITGGWLTAYELPSVTR